MARPRTTGPNIQFRLPLELHERLEARIDGTERTIHQEAANIVTAGLELDLAIQAAGRTIPGTVDLDLDKPVDLDLDKPCDHALAKTRSSGVKVCPRCGATQTGKGPWVPA